MAKDTLDKALPKAGQSATITLKGRQFDITPASVGDWLALKCFIRGKRGQDFAAMADAASLPPEQKMQGVKELAMSTLSELEVLHFAATEEGSIFMLYRSLLRSEPEMSYEGMLKLLEGEDMQALEVMQKNVGQEEEIVDILKNPSGAATGSDSTT